MELLPPPSNFMKKTRVYWDATQGCHLAGNSFGPATGALYLAPIDSPGDWGINLYKIKYTYAALGPPAFVCTWEVRVGVYRLMRGSGGTANTWVLCPNSQAVGTHVAIAPATGTFYTEPVAAAGISFLPEAVYAIGILFVNTTALPGNVAWNLFGHTLPSFVDWFYGAGGGGHATLPASVATLGTLSAFKIYVETS